jgi:hypothetical protein
MLIEKKSRQIKDFVQTALWGASAGRCQFAGCNKPLSYHHVTKEEVNVAQKAHIYAFSESGPRGNDGIEVENLNSIENLLLACHGCHKLIDDSSYLERYTVEELHRMKKAHERRIELVTGIDINKQSHVLLFGANIGTQNPVLEFKAAASAMFPDYFPADRSAIELGFGVNDFEDHEREFWFFEKSALEKSFDKRVKPLLQSGEIKHLSIFGLAPQPLLIQLGTLLVDIAGVEVYQRLREPATWKWQNDNEVENFDVIEPAISSDIIAINLSISATIDNARIHSVLGEKVAIYTVTVPTPHNDIIRSKTQLKHFRQTLRKLLDSIKLNNPNATCLNVFPAMPVSCAIEFGRINMPKADLPLSIFDEQRGQGGFVHTFNINPQMNKA